MSSESARRFELPRGVVEQLAAHALARLPEECCGILIGSKRASGRARVHYARESENASHASRERHYTIAPPALLEAQRAARGEGLEILGYYHSHPSGSATPSALDLANAWPDTSYVILGMDEGGVSRVRSWRLAPGRDAFVEEVICCTGPWPHEDPSEER